LSSLLRIAYRRENGKRKSLGRRIFLKKFPFISIPTSNNIFDEFFLSLVGNHDIEE
jgi:hypothetical protein